MREARRAAAIAVLVACALLSTSCSRWFWVVVAGSLAEGVAFSFRQEPDGEPWVPLRIQTVEVFDGETQIWSIRGNGYLRSLRYGELPRGFALEEAARPLEPGKLYFVVASDKSWPGPPGSASQPFQISADGGVTSCGPCTRCSLLKPNEDYPPCPEPL